MRCLFDDKVKHMECLFDEKVKCMVELLIANEREGERRLLNLHEQFGEVNSSDNETFLNRTPPTTTLVPMVSRFHYTCACTIYL